MLHLHGGRYRAPETSPYVRWPVFVGPIFEWPSRPPTYWAAWRRAVGAEVSFFGRAFYVFGCSG